jgi:hypothetical protein
MPACLKESSPNIKASFYKCRFSEFCLTWLVNELSSLTIHCEAGLMVTTGTCRVPVKPMGYCGSGLWRALYSLLPLLLNPWMPA